MLDTVLHGLLAQYEKNVPEVGQIVAAMIKENLISSRQDIVNDHIAFRSLGVPFLGIALLERIFLHLGYTKRDPYYFDRKKLDAFWYSPPDPQYPRIFISELRVRELSSEARSIIRSYTDSVSADPLADVNLNHSQSVVDFLHRPLWRTPSWSDYQHLAKESEYAAWVIYNRYYLNHFTLSIHDLPEGFNTIKNFNRFVEKQGISLNDSGGKIKTSRDGKLIQSSTVSSLIPALFCEPNGTESRHLIAGSYVEFAERLPVEGSTLRRDGFDSGNANRIFESTYSSQTERNLDD